MGCRDDEWAAFVIDAEAELRCFLGTKDPKIQNNSPMSSN